MKCGRKLNRGKGYTRTITALYRAMKRLNIKFYKGMEIYFQFI